MNILLDKLPTSVNINGVDYQINSDFRAAIAFEILMEDDSLTDEEKVLEGLELFYGSIPHDPTVAVEAIIEFYGGGSREETQTGAKGGGSNKRIYSFAHDDSYIYAAFLSQYRIDLNDVEYLHWWKFKALFEALNEENQIMKIMAYRAMEIDGEMSKKQKEFYKSMQRRYKLPEPKSERQKIDTVQAALLRGEDPAGLL